MEEKSLTAWEEFPDPVVLIRISQLYRTGMSEAELYDVTRGIWKMGERREGARYALAVYARQVLEAYEIETWHPAGSTPYVSRRFEPEELEGRWEFLGHVADEAVRARYVGADVSALFLPGNANPFMYVNC
jgi:hypothetical protein